MCAPSNGKPLNPGAESWKPEQGAKMEPRLPHQFFPPPPPPPQPPRLFLPTYGNNFYTLPSSEYLPSYYNLTAAAGGKYVYVDHQFVPLDPHHYGYFSLSNFHNTPISYYYHPLLHPFIPKHPNAVQGMNGASGERDAVSPVKEGSSLGGKVVPEKEERKTAASDFVAVNGNARDGGCGDTGRMISMKEKKGFVATVPPRFLRNGRSCKDGWYRTTTAANATRKSSRVFSLKWKPKCGGGGGVDQGVKESVDSSDMANTNQNDDPLSSNKTTVMIKNIPNKLRRHSLIQFLDRYCKDHNLEYDFIYLPMDFKRLDNLGYAFVNFTSASSAVRIRELLHNYKWGTGCGVVVPTTSTRIPGYGPSKKICQVTWARIQGKDELVSHFETSAFACHTDEYLPAVMDPPRNGLTSLTIPKAIGKVKPPGSLYPLHLLRTKNNQSVPPAHCSLFDVR